MSVEHNVCLFERSPLGAFDIHRLRLSKHSNVVRHTLWNSRLFGENTTWAVQGTTGAHRWTARYLIVLEDFEVCLQNETKQCFDVTELDCTYEFLI